MEFEDMQIIWNEQNDEKLFVLDEAAVHAGIQRKGNKVNKMLGFVDWVMMGINFLVAIWLTVDAVRDGGPNFQYGIAALYLVYAVVTLYRRLARRRDQVQFPDTMLGDLEKAIWQSEYLIRQGNGLILWYLLPLMGAVALLTYLDDGALWGLGLALVVLPATYFATRWEMRKFHLPRKRELEALRKTLLAAEPEA